MELQDEEYALLESPAEVAESLASLMRHHGASLQLEQPGSVPLPVVLLAAEPGEPLLVDVSSVREVAGDLRRGAAFRLLGQSGGKFLRTLPLQALEFSEEAGVLQCRCARPEAIEALQRREDFRAELRLGLDCDVLIDGGGELGAWDGKLRNLSMRGCLVELPLAAASMLASVDGALDVELCFPDGSGIRLFGKLRHQQSDTEQRFVRAGFEFCRTDAQQDRELWHFVREIEREQIRHAAGDKSNLPMSPLFVVSEEQAARRAGAPRRRGEEYPTPMSRSLSFIAEFLNTQILSLRTGGNIDAAQLSRQAERLLLLHEQNREALLFATVCLWQEPPLVRHGLGVAVKLIDLAGAELPRELRKAMAASAMVHDLGKALLPPGLLEKPAFSPEDYRCMRGHVALLRPRLADCGWLGEEVRGPVVEQANERLDGSGYPEGLNGDRLRALARMTAVVDVADAMCRWRPGRGAHAADVIQRQLQAQPGRLDPRWVKSYLRHFGRYPIGSLLRFESGQLGWVAGLDGERRLERLYLSSQQGPPRSAWLSDLVEGDALRALGAPVAVLPAEWPRSAETPRANL